MILFLNNSTMMFLSYEQIVVPIEVVSSHGYGGVTPRKAHVEIEKMDFVKMKREDEELIMIAPQIILRNGTYRLS
jgi:phage gpG-like protein